MRIMKNLVQSFLRLFYNGLIYRGMYAIHSGDKAGGFFVYIKEEDRGACHALLIMPSPMEAIYVTKEEIKIDLKFKNIKFVERIPHPVYEVCKADFLYRAKKAGIHA